MNQTQPQPSSPPNSAPEFDATELSESEHSVWITGYREGYREGRNAAEREMEAEFTKLRQLIQAIAWLAKGT